MRTANQGHSLAGVKLFAVQILSLSLSHMLTFLLVVSHAGVMSSLAPMEEKNGRKKGNIRTNKSRIILMFVRFQESLLEKALCCSSYVYRWKTKVAAPTLRILTLEGFPPRLMLSINSLHRQMTARKISKKEEKRFSKIFSRKKRETMENAPFWWCIENKNLQISYLLVRKRRTKTARDEV